VTIISQSDKIWSVKFRRLYQVLFVQFMHVIYFTLLCTAYYPLELVLITVHMSKASLRTLEDVEKCWTFKPDALFY
jgi:hypothetical protein